MDRFKEEFKHNVQELQHCEMCDYEWCVSGDEDNGNFVPYDDDWLICPECGHKHEEVG